MVLHSRNRSWSNRKCQRRERESAAIDKLSERQTGQHGVILLTFFIVCNCHSFTNGVHCVSNDRKCQVPNQSRGSSQLFAFSHENTHAFPPGKGKKERYVHVVTGDLHCHFQDCVKPYYFAFIIFNYAVVCKVLVQPIIFSTVSVKGEGHHLRVKCHLWSSHLCFETFETFQSTGTIKAVIWFIKMGKWENILKLNTIRQKMHKYINVFIHLHYRPKVFGSLFCTKASFMWSKIKQKQ